VGRRRSTSLSPIIGGTIPGKLNTLPWHTWNSGFSGTGQCALQVVLCLVREFSARVRGPWGVRRVKSKKEGPAPQTNSAFFPAFSVSTGLLLGWLLISVGSKDDRKEHRGVMILPKFTERVHFPDSPQS
jgi:hypothetical protein